MCLSAALAQASQLICLRYKPGLCEAQMQATDGCGPSFGGAFFLPLSEMNSLFGKGGRSYCGASRLAFEA